MEIRDVIHGSILIESGELPIIDSRTFQRLREIKQLGFAEFSFPAATHNRYSHSLGAMGTASRAFNTIFHEPLQRLRAVVRLAALLHDIGHGPLSHTTEFAMPKLSSLNLPSSVKRTGARRANHEDYTLKILLDSELTPLLEQAGSLHGFTPLHIASLIDPSVEVKDNFFMGELEGAPTDFRPILQQLISSEIDADRMDYLRRDSFHTGVSYGQFDFDWLIGNLTYHIKNGKCYLSLKHRALYAFEDFLISRFHMFLMVYFHHKSVVFDSLLARYFESADKSGESPYELPSDIDAYIKCTDAHLMAHLQKSKNTWAKLIIARHPYRMLMELHSGIPAGKAAAAEQDRLFNQLQKDLKGKNIDFLAVTSTGELSKYFRKPGNPIYVRYDNHYSAPSFIQLERCTDLFERYQEKRSISRLYVSAEDFSKCRNEGRKTPFQYEGN